MGTESSPLVTISEGVLKGSVKSDIHGESFCSFQGIPYAEPPVGKLRFKPPKLPAKWTGIRDAQREASECYTKNFGVFGGSEDCLYLNVFTKKISTKLKPVMVFIHGGGFTTGSSKTEIYGPEYLMTEDIVLVTFNYRLGPLGFMVIDDPCLGVTGNAGLKDMVMVLQWVQRNIKKFGGDPKNVTVFGESAGAAAVHFLMLSPKSKGLFHKAIGQSGCALNLWTRGKKHSAYILAEALGIHSKNNSVILERLQEVSVEELLKGFEKIGDPFVMARSRTFCPTIEEPTKDAFLWEEPLHIIKSGKYHKVPLILGCCSAEGMFMYGLCANSTKSNLVLHHTTLIPSSMNLREQSPVYHETVDAIKRYYFGDKEPLEEEDTIFRLYTANFLLLEVYNTAKYHLKTSKKPIYFYQFSVDSEMNLMKNVYQINKPGVCHADDICYLFKTSFSPELTPNSKESRAVHRMVKLWTNFAKYSNPTPDGDDPLLNVKWKSISEKDFNVLDIGDELKLMPDHPEKEALEFWNDLHVSTQAKL